MSDSIEFGLLLAPIKDSSDETRWGIGDGGDRLVGKLRPRAALCARVRTRADSPTYYLVCQSGPGSWPAEVYTKAAVYPMANTAAQDIFPHIPGDTDYRIFSEDFGDIPGLDIILLLEGYFYHTPYDRPERIIPGSMQIRGENLMGLLRAFSSSPQLLNARDRTALKVNQTLGREKRPIFFDFLGWFMITYSFNTAVVLHTLPLGFVLFVSSVASYQSSGIHYFSERILFIVKGALLHSIQMALALFFPVMLVIVKLLPASTAMTWFSQPWLALLMFVPISIAGLLLPRVLLARKLMMKGSTSASVGKKAMDWGIHWGAIAMYSFGATVSTHFVVGNGFLSFWWASFLLPAYYLLHISQRSFGRQSILSYLLYIFSLALPILLSLYVGGMFWQTLLEKMGMNGSVPQPLDLPDTNLEANMISGFFVADIIIAATTGYAVLLAVGPLIPVIGCWLASTQIVCFLIFVSVLAAAISSSFFPYSPSAPKRVLLQHTINNDGNQILHSYYDLAIFDANSVPFVFKHVQEVPKFLMLTDDFNSKIATRSPSGTWMALYPISHLFVESFRFPAGSKDVLKNHPKLPHLLLQNVEHRLNQGQKRMHVELDLGSLHEVWAAVLNITGPLLNWSFSGQQLPDVLLIQNIKWKGPIFIGRDTSSLRTRFSPTEYGSDSWTEDRVVYQLMFAIEALLESIWIPVEDIEELVDLT
ncbi:hypothetical protein L7F22_008172 [Adiantum nelumboides]|nr:hypothetical protein [Adiantum nelumboides]